MSTKEPEPKPQLCYSRVSPGSYQIKLLCPRCSVQVSKNELSCLGLQFFDRSHRKYVRKILVFLELDKFYSPKPGYSSRGFITCLNKAKLFVFIESKRISSSIFKGRNKVNGDQLRYGAGFHRWYRFQGVGNLTSCCERICSPSTLINEDIKRKLNSLLKFLSLRLQRKLIANCGEVQAENIHCNLNSHFI